MSESTGFQIVAIKGSVRPGNYTSMALQLVVDELSKEPGVGVRVFDPAEMDLPAPGVEWETEDTRVLQDAVSSATGLVLSTPEYHGSPSSVIKLVIENLGFPSAMAGKPVALLGVAAGRIGAIKSLEMLRSICSHVGALPLPGSVSVAGVRDVFDEEGNCLDEKLEEVIRGVATSLLEFVHDHVCPKFALEAMVRE
jgi:NAD(P)H-dependent FMN reductase